MLQGYAWGLFPFGVYVLLQKVLYAYQKYSVVFIFVFVFTVIDIILSYILINTWLGVTGLSVAYTLSTIIILPFIYVYVVRIIPINIVLKKYFAIIIGIIPLLLVSIIASRYTQKYWIHGSTIQNIIIFIVLAFILLTILIIGYRLVGINIIQLSKIINKKESC